MARTKSDISNSAIRIFLQNVGEFYDEARGFPKFKSTAKQKKELLEPFSYECCYCGSPIDEKNLSLDHLIPMNKTHLGLHAWGNIVPCCQLCNNQKQQKSWEEFLAIKCPEEKLRDKRRNIIKDFVIQKEYDPKLDLHAFAGNLYQDVGEVAMTLINLRYKQAADVIERSINKKK